jgi:hypothetical protein
MRIILRSFFVMCCLYSALLVMLAVAPHTLLSQVAPEAVAHGPATVHIYRTGSHGNAIKVLIDRRRRSRWPTMRRLPSSYHLASMR